MALYIVNSAADADPNDEFITLREAITAANGSTEADVIQFDASVFAELETITLGSALPAITGTLTVTGPAAGVVVDADSQGRVFDIAANADVTMTGMTITGGDVTGDGGGIAVANGATLSLSDSTVFGSAASGNGGGIHNEGSLTLDAVTISGNTAATGGGIWSNGTIGSSANVTVANNTATANDGGGIWNSGSATFLSATIWGNEATTSNVGNGISNSGTFNLENSIVAGNSDASQINGTAPEGDDNLTGDTAYAETIFAKVNDDGDDGTTPEVIALADNGGPVETLALLASGDNPAIDAADGIDEDDADTPETDARGTARPQEAGTDIGAYELEYTAPTATDDADAVAAGAITAKTQLTGVLANDAGVVDGTDDIAVTNIGSGGTSAPISGGSEETITGAYGDLTMESDGSYSYTANADDAKELDAGEEADDVFTYTVTEADGFASTATLTVTVTGANEAPEAAADEFTTAEAAADQNASVFTDGADSDVDDGDDEDDGGTLVRDFSVTGIRTVTRVDGDDDTKGDLETVEATGTKTIDGLYGTLSIAADGSVSYEVDVEKAKAVPGGATKADVFEYTITDGAGASDAAEVVINVAGANDAPTASDVTIAAEDADNTDNATLAGSFSDVDTDEALTVKEVEFGTAGAVPATTAGAVVAGAYGDLIIREDGSYSYALATAGTQLDAYEALAEDQIGAEVFTYTVEDDEGAEAEATLTINVTGVNDDPTADPFPETDAGDVEDGDDAQFVFGDPDGDDTVSVTKVSFEGVANDDDSEAMVGETAGVVQGKYGTLTIDAEGGFFYTENLGAKAAVDPDVFTVTVTDDKGKTAEATISVDPTEADDDPAAMDDAITAAAAAKGGDVLANDDDPDLDDDSLTVSQVAVSGQPLGAIGDPSEITTSNGVLTINADGSYTYAKLAAATADEDGVLDAFDYEVTSGGNTATATLTIYAMAEAVDDAISMADASEGSNVLTNDEAEVGTGGTLAVTGIAVGSGGVTAVTDAEAAMVMGAYGSLTIASDGAYSYAAGGDAYAALDAGEAMEDVFTYTVSDGSMSDTASITVAVTGVNDLPVAMDETVAADDAEEGDGASLADKVSDVDGATAPTVTGIMVDGGETETVVSAEGSLVLGSFGILLVKSDGSYYYDVSDDAPASIGAGETGTDAFSYTVTDADGGTATAKLMVTVDGEGAPSTGGGEPVTGTGGSETLRGGDGDETFSAGGGDDKVKAGAGNDTVFGGRGADKLKGDAGDDVLDGGSGRDKLKGGDGDDNLRGGSGDDKLKGNDGNDRLEGEAGDDKLKGGEGSDTFVFGEGRDVIRDFEAGDVIELSAGLFDGPLSAEGVVEDFGRAKDDKFVLDFGDGDVLVIKDADADAVEAAIVFG